MSAHASHGSPQATAIPSKAPPAALLGDGRAPFVKPAPRVPRRSVDPAFADERIICEYVPSMQGLNKIAGALPLGLGILLFVPQYVLRLANVFSGERYVLTNRRLRIDRGVRRNPGQSVPLEQIDELRLTNEVTFTRTADIEVIVKGKVEMTLVGMHDAEPARRTILKAIEARKQVKRAVDDEQARKRAGAV